MTNTLCKNTNQYLANIGVSYIKLHNLHWNVTGAQFKAVHEYLESLYDAYAGVLDEIAEIIRMNGQMPFASLEDYLSVATIDELKSREICVKDTLTIVLADMEILKSDAEKLRKEAAEEDNYLLVNALEDQLTNYAKNIWFLRSTLKQLHKSDSCPV